jgi:hypothetical protein
MKKIMVDERLASIAKRIEGGREIDLQKIEGQGIGRMALVTVVILDAEKRLCMSPISIERFRDRKGKRSDTGSLFRKTFRKDHEQGQMLIVKSILSVNPNFDAWEALSRVFDAAYTIVGRERRQYRRKNKKKPVEAAFASADQLMRIAREYRKGATP